MSIKCSDSYKGLHSCFLTQRFKNQRGETRRHGNAALFVPCLLTPPNHACLSSSGKPWQPPWVPHLVSMVWDVPPLKSCCCAAYPRQLGNTAACDARRPRSHSAVFHLHNHDSSIPTKHPQKTHPPADESAIKFGFFSGRCACPRRRQTRGVARPYDPTLS